MKKTWYILLLAFTVLNCNSNKNNAQLSDFIPNNSSIIISINNLESYKSNVNNNHFLETLSLTNAYRNIEDKLQNLKYLKTPEPLLVCLSHDEKDSIQYTVIAKLTKGIFETDSLQDILVETLSFEKHTFQKITHNNQVTFSTIKDSVFLASSSRHILESTLAFKNNNKNLNAILSTSDESKTFSIFIDDTKLKSPYSFFINDSTNTVSFTNYTLLDADLNQDQLILNGITKAVDSTHSLINIFKESVPQENLIAQITPSNSDGFMSFTFDEFSTFKNQLVKYNDIDSVLTETTLFDNIIEVGVIYQSEDRAIVLNSLDVISTKDALLNDQNISETYRQIPIFDFSDSEIFNRTFSPLITFKDANYYVEVDTFFLFGNSIEILQNIIANHQNKTTFNERRYYKDIKNHLTDEASLLVVANGPSLKKILERNFKSDLNMSLDPYKTTAIQFIYDTNFAHINAVINKNKSRAIENSVSEAYTIKLDAELLNSPQLVKNHITKQKEICVQDINNTLYLISNSGKVLWKKQIQGEVLGEIEQIDMYKNGRLQLAFATSNRVYVLDRNGKDVAPFPIKFNDEITQPLSVFDYDKKKKYRLLVTQGKNVLMFDGLGKTVKGFKFKSAESTINHQPQHFRRKGKDYLTIKTDNKLHILDRTGKTRVTPKDNYTYSSQGIYLYQNQFTTTSKTGALIRINTNGNTSSENINLTETHALVTTSKTLVAQTENQLTIKRNVIDLDFGNYTAPKLFYINDKIYVSVTDLQTQKVYLFDSNAKGLYNFPVYGNSSITLDNIDKDQNLEFVTKGENNSIIIYQIN